MAQKNLGSDYGVHSAYFGGNFYVVWRETEGTNIQAGFLCAEGSAHEELKLCDESSAPFAVAAEMPNVDIDTSNTTEGDQWRFYLLGMGSILWNSNDANDDDDLLAGSLVMASDTAAKDGHFSLWAYTDADSAVTNSISTCYGRVFYDETLGNTTGTDNYLWCRIICSL